MEDDDDDDIDDPPEDPVSLVDVPLPTYVADLPQHASLEELAEAYYRTEIKEERGERVKAAVAKEQYEILLARMIIAVKARTYFAAKNAEKRQDSAVVMKEFYQFGVEVLGVKRTQFYKYLRLGQRIGDIHKATQQMRDEQFANQKPMTYPTLNTMVKWFPEDPLAAEEQAIKRQAAKDAATSFRNMQEEERERDYMEVVDKLSETRQALDRERHERWDADTEYQGRITDLLLETQHLTREVERLTAENKTLTEQLKRVQEPPVDQPSRGKLH
jgi:hypothetical protein